MRVPFLALAILAAGLVAAPRALPANERAPQFTAVAVAPLYPPRPFRGADGAVHLAYEITIVNMTSLVVGIDEVAVVDEAGGDPLARWAGDRLASVLRINGHDKGVVLGPSQSAIVFLDVALPEGRAVPKAVAHRLATTRMLKAPGDDLHKGVALPPTVGIPSTVTFQTPAVAVDLRPAVRLSPPLRGDGWIVGNGCCDTVTSHRGAAMAFDGVVKVPERFAIDFVKLGPAGTLFTGASDRPESYPGFDQPIHAAGAGMVVEVVDGMPEQVPGKSATGVTTDNAAGNHVVVDMGEGNFALYAHIKTGTTAVRKGDRVTVGQIIGRLGNTGNSDAPHLHFHVMDGPSPLASQGLPYVFEQFDGQGRADLDEDQAFAGKPVSIDKGWHAGTLRGALPLNNQVVDFGR